MAEVVVMAYNETRGTAVVSTIVHLLIVPRDPGAVAMCRWSSIDGVLRTWPEGRR